jgi:hypothetical protein
VKCGGEVLLAGIHLLPAPTSCPISISCPPSTQLIVLCAALYVGKCGGSVLLAGGAGGAGGAGQGRLY